MFEHGYDAYFQRATLRYNSARGEGVELFTEDGEKQRADVTAPDAFVAELTAAVAAVRTGEGGVLSRQLARDSLRLVLAEAESVRTGSPMSLQMRGISMRLEGILPPMVTPLDAEEQLDEAGLERQLDRLLASGVHGVYLLGSTGEMPALREAVRRRVVERAAQIIRGRVPLVVGCMASSTAKAIDNIRMAEAAGADAVAVTPPHYYSLSGPAEMREHYRRCAASTSLPLIVYNIPSTTKVMLSPETIMAIGALPRVAGIKDSSGDFAHVLRILALRGDDEFFSVLVGSLPIGGPALLMGADGMVPGPGNLDPGLMVELYERGHAGDAAGVRALQPRVYSLLRVLEFGPVVSCLKTALELMGVCSAHVTAPFPTLGDRERAGLAAALREHGLLPA